MKEGFIPRWINFDQYQRYHFIERVIHAFSDDRKLKILEVGGAFSSALHHLSSKHHIWISDTATAPDIDLRASGIKLPFPSMTFDCVVCTDVLEHVPESERKQMIQELQRVTNGILILGFPQNTIESRVAEDVLSEWIQESSGSEYTFLSEHKSFGLPEAESVRDALQSSGGMILQADNANIYSWLPMMMSYFAIEKYDEFDEPKKSLNEIFNENYEPDSHNLPSYRKFYLWFHDSSSETIFHNVKSALLEAPQKPLQDFAWSSLALSMSFEHALRRVQKIAQQRLEQIEAGHTELESIRNSSIRLEAHLKSLNREIELLQDQRQELIKKVDGVGEELKERAKWIGGQNQKIKELEANAAEDRKESARQLEMADRRYQELQQKSIQQVREMQTAMEKQRQQMQESIDNQRLTMQEAIEKQQVGFQEAIERQRETMEATIQRQKLSVEKQRQEIEQRDQKVETLSISLEEARRVQQETIDLHQKQQEQVKSQIAHMQNVYEQQVSGLQIQLHHTEQYLRLFLNHPIYRLYKFFKGNRSEAPIINYIQNSPSAILTDETEAKSKLEDANRQFLIGDLEGALQIYRSISQKYPRDEQVVSGLVRVLGARGEFSEAQHILVDALNHKPGSIPFLLLLASNYLSTGTFWEAESLFRKIVEIDPKNIQALLGLADLAMGDAKYQQAFSYYERVLNIDPKNLAALSGIAECDLHDTSAAVRAKQLRSAHTNEPLLISVLGEQKQENHKSLVSIVIPVFNQLNYTRQCLEEIRKSTAHPHEVIIVDNGSSDGTQEYLQSIKSDGIKIIRNSENIGFVDACNQGAELAAGEYLVFLNNDTVPRPRWLEALVQTAENDSHVGAVGAKLLYPDGALQEAGSLVFYDAIAWNYGKGDEAQKPEYNYLRETPYCSAACLLIHRNLFRDIGGFDKRYSPAYWEDVDLAFEVRKRGFKVMYQPAAEIVHFEGVTGGTNTNHGYKKFQVRNKEIFQQKWATELKQQPNFDREKLKSSSIQNPNTRILVVDHYLPVFDRNSGNHRAYQLMRLIRKADYPLTFVARNGEYQTRYKQELENLGIETYATDRNHLQAAGYSPAVPSIRWEELLSQGNYGLAILSRYENARIYLPIIRVYSPESRIVLDTVDVHFLREQRKAELYGTDHLHKHASQTKESELDVCRKADALITVTDEDANVLRKELGIEKPVWVIPNIHPVEKAPTPFHSRSGLLFVGNFVHPPNTDAMYYFCGQVLPLIRKKLPDLYLYIVGGNSLPLLQGLQSEKVIITGYVPSTRPFLDTCRLSVNPLRYGAGMKGKIGEAMSRGLPVITTSIGAEGFQIQSGVQALIADTAEDFADAVIHAYSDESAWNNLSENGLRMIEQHYSPDAVLPTVLALLNWD